MFFRSNEFVKNVNEEGTDSTEDATISVELFDKNEPYDVDANLTSAHNEMTTKKTSSLKPSKPNSNEQTQGSCSPLEGNYDTLTQVKFAKKLTNDCRYDRLTIPETDGPQIVYLQINLKHIEAIDQLVSK